MPNNKRKYDIVIIGSGIGGLVAAAYLAKAGLKVLIVEKNSEAGGYCTSFNRRGRTFDTTIHAIQSCEEGTVLYKVFNELGIYRKLNLIRANPTDTIVYRERIIHITNDISQTKQNFINQFPFEKEGVLKFFNILTTSNFVQLFYKFRKVTYRDLLNQCFKQDALKSIFSILLGNIGSQPSSTSAISAIALLKQFIISGGYYPEHGMQQIPNLLLNIIRECNGEVLLDHLVTEVIGDSNSVEGIRLLSGETIQSRRILVNSSLEYSVNKLLRKIEFENKKLLIANLGSLKPSSSIYIVYLVLNTTLKNSINSGPGLWYIPGDLPYDNLNGVNRLILNPGIFISIASKLNDNLLLNNQDQIRIMVNVDFKPQQYWAKNGKSISDYLIHLAEKAIPGLQKMIICQGRATPITMQNYTLNFNGAVAGWMNSPATLNMQIANYLPRIKGLYFVGHWITTKYGNGGVAMAAESGRKTSMKILKEF